METYKPIFLKIHIVLLLYRISAYYTIPAICHCQFSRYNSKPSSRGYQQFKEPILQHMDSSPLNYQKAKKLKIWSATQSCLPNILPKTSALTCQASRKRSTLCISFRLKNRCTFIMTHFTVPTFKQEKKERTQSSSFFTRSVKALQNVFQ